MNEEQNNLLAPVDMTGRVYSAIDFGMGADEAEETRNTSEPHPNFIESNTAEISLQDLVTKCIVPTFSDNSLTIAHQNFIACVAKAASEVFGDITPIEIRVSHPINGRTPEALYKKDSELRDDEKTIFYQRMAFVSHVASLTRTINGQEVHLCIGGVRAYNEDKLYNRKSPEKFKIFAGWQVRVCSNLMLTCSGNSGTIECMTEADVYQKAYQLFSAYNPEKDNDLTLLQNLNNTVLTEEQFCKIIGRMRLYQFLPTNEQNELPELTIGDQAVNAAVKNYVSNPNFGRKPGQDITCWNLLQLLNEAVKQAYIDRWLDRNQNCTDFAIGIQKALTTGDSSGLAYSWFLQ